MVAVLIAMAVMLSALAAELLHRRRSRRVARLAFGPSGRPRLWAMAAPLTRVLALGAMSWGLATLSVLQPKVHDASKIDKKDMRHLLVVLDVSPSMNLKDAGKAKLSRMKRASELMESLFQRTDIARFWITVVATYNGAKPVVVDTTDLEVVRNILNDLPMNYAFKSGQTRLFDGLEEAARIARPWTARTTLLLVSDGDTVPATGMPKIPASVSHALVVGVGDAHTGSFIDGRQSRQDASTLRQIAVRLGGLYHDGNEKHIPTETLESYVSGGRPGRFEKLTRREYAIAATVLGAFIHSLLPLLLHKFGTGWRPGVRSKDLTAIDESFTTRTREFARPAGQVV